MKNKDKDLHWFNTLSESAPSEDTELIKSEVLFLAKYVDETVKWIKDLEHNLQIESTEIAWNVLRSVLHVFRDRLTPEEAFHLSAQLPMLLRGLFFEGYRISDKPEKFDVDKMLYRIDEKLTTQQKNAEQAFRATLQVLYKYISEGQLEDMYGIMPGDIRELWDISLNRRSHT